MAQTRAISPPTSRCRMSASCACWPGWTPRSISACSPSSASSRMTRCRSMSTPCAPPEAALLVALFPGDLTLQEAQQLLHNRPRTGWSSVAAFLAQPTLQKTDTTLARPSADGAQRTLYRSFYRGDWQSPLSAVQRPATIGAHVYRRPAAIWTLYGGR